MDTPARHDPDYIKRREEQHRALAERAEDDKAREAHTDLAARFAAMLTPPD